MSLLWPVRSLTKCRSAPQRGPAPFPVAAGTPRQPQADRPTSPGAGGELESGLLDREQTFGLGAVAGLLPNLPQPGPPSPVGCWMVCGGKAGECRGGYR